MIENLLSITHSIAENPEFRQIIKDVFNQTAYVDVGETAESLANNPGNLIFDRMTNTILETVAKAGIALVDITHLESEDADDIDEVDDALYSFFIDLGHDADDVLTEEEQEMEDVDKRFKMIKERAREVVANEVGTLLYRCFDTLMMPSSLYNWLCKESDMDIYY